LDVNGYIFQGENMVRKFVWAVAFLAFSFLILPGEEMPPSPDTESTVPELIAFHDVIYPIWHTAYPEKDCAALRGFIPEINSGFEKIEKAILPGILRDRTEAWKKGLAEFKRTVDEYNEAAAGSDDQALLAAAETLHARFEMMIRIIRPVLKEIGAYHQVLYVVFHKYLPQKKYGEIKAASGDMVVKAEAIARTQLPKRLEAKSVPFQAATGKLLAETKGFFETCKTGNGEAIETAIQSMHNAYQALEKVFD
jgi:hypothetical protein